MSARLTLDDRLVSLSPNAGPGRAGPYCATKIQSVSTLCCSAVSKRMVDVQGRRLSSSHVEKWRRVVLPAPMKGEGEKTPSLGKGVRVHFRSVGKGGKRGQSTFPVDWRITGLTKEMYSDPFFADPFFACSTSRPGRRLTEALFLSRPRKRWRGS